MKRKLNILLLTLACFFGHSPKSQAQPPLRQCIEGKSQFAVKGHELSTFRYEISGGTLVDTVRRDSLVVKWGARSGMGRIGVQEVAFGGCEGEWVYIDVDLIGTLLFSDSDTLEFDGTPIHVPVDQNLFKKVQWLDNEIDTKGITEPGEYKVRVEDMRGCVRVETVQVVDIRGISPPSESKTKLKN